MSENGEGRAHYSVDYYSKELPERSMRIKPEQKLWESDRFMELFFSQCMEGIWFMEAEEPFLWNDEIDKEKALDYAFEHQHIVRVNEAMLKQYDATIDQFLGLTLTDFFAHDLENARVMWRKIFDAGKLTVESQEHRFKNGQKFEGEEVWFLGDYFCIYNENGEMVGHFGSQRDITQRKYIERALKESEERYRSLATSVADGIMVIQDEKLTVVNDAFVRMFNYVDRRQLIGKNILEIMSAELHQSYKELAEKYKSENENTSGNAGITRTDIEQGICFSREGRTFWVEGHTSPIKWAGRFALLSVVRDINDRKLAEIATQEKAEDLYQENLKLRSSIKDRYRFCNIVGKSAAMQEVYELIIRAASSDANVVIYGESGTGKELVAQAIHKISDRGKKPFVPVNCHAIPENLLESEFFGHKKGAFTGAYKDKPGFLEMANTGDIFLDEIGDLNIAIQGKLLRAVEGGGFSPVGSTKILESNFRIIAATNKNMLDLVRKGTMREDFYYRIHIVPINLPPLRDRKDDVPLLIDHFLSSFKENGKDFRIPGHVLEALYRYDWPGNVRELQNALQRYLTVGNISFLGKEFSTNDIPQTGRISDGEQLSSSKLDFRDLIASYERSLIYESLKAHNWNRNKVTVNLNMPRRTLYYKMKKYGFL